jgi:hypothetical protein
MTVKELRSIGFKVRVLHFRKPSTKFRINGEKFEDYSTPSPKGGATKVVIDSPDGQHFEGKAKCSDDDNYDKKLGIRIALGRAGLNYSF